MQTERVMPHNLKVERSVIAAILKEPPLIDTAVSLQMDGDCLYSHIHREIWLSCHQMRMSGDKIDLVTVANHLHMRKKFEMVGGNEGMAEIYGTIATTVNFEEWVNLLIKLAAKRKLIITCHDTLNKCYSDNKPVKELLAVHSDKIAEISGMTQHKHRTTQEILEATDKMFSDGIDGNQVVKYCIPSVDNSIIHARQQMHVLAAFPGTGKTAFGLSAIAEQIKAGLVCVIFCKESSCEELLGKLLGIYSGIPYIQLQTRIDKLEEAKLAEYNRARDLINKYQDNLFIFGGGNYKHSIEGIRGAMRRIRDERGQIDAAYVDYLQNMNPPRHMERKDKTPQVEYNIEALKDTFIDFNCAGTVLSQINRIGAQAGKPKMQHLKYAGAIEAEAHIISFLYREKINDPTKDELETLWYSEKTRLFAPFIRSLIFKKDTAQYYGRYAATDRPEK